MRYSTITDIQRRNLIPPCDEKVCYGTESLARQTGRRRALEANIDLWVYECPYGQHWHLTSKPRTPQWHVLAECCEQDDFEDITQDRFFWNKLLHMEHCEADAMVRRARTGAIAEQMRTDDVNYKIRLQNFVTRLNEELHVLSQARDKRLWNTVILNLYGQEVLDTIRTEVARLSKLEPVNVESKKGEV